MDRSECELQMQNCEGSSGFRVLIADDDPALLAATARLCRKEGHQVIEASNGTKAAELIRQEKPDLALIDVHLGDMDGRDLCRDLRAEPDLDSTFFVLLTGVAVHSEDLVRGLEGGADGYILRPVSNRELRAWINTYLRLRKAGHRQSARERELLLNNDLLKDEIQAGARDLETTVDSIVAREVRMAELKEEIYMLRSKLRDHGVQLEDYDHM